MRLRVKVLVGAVVAALALALATGSALAKPTSTSGPGCPGPKSIQGLPTDNNVGASAVTNGDTTDYKLYSNDQGAVNGVPGLVKYCVYPTNPGAAPTVDVTAQGGPDEDIPWTKTTSSKSPYNFSFQRPGGNYTNIWFDEDNETTDMGTADWGSTTAVPTSQKIVLHVADPNLCGTAATCFVKPGAVVCNAGAGSDTFGYNALPFGFNRGCDPPPSFGFEANPGTSEFGNGVGVATGPNIKKLTVDFQSYGCGDSGHWYDGQCKTTPGETFTIPQEGAVQGITANLYAVGAGDTVGTLLGSATNTDPIPYRPSADPSCPDPAQFKNAAGQCVNSLTHLITFDFGSGVSVPAEGKVIWTVTFNTTNSGYVPLGALTCRTANGGDPGCGYDSLNVGTKTYPGSPYAGSELNADDVYWNKTNAPIAGLAPTSAWTGFQPLAQITTG
jgi:hypothetical protein